MSILTLAVLVAWDGSAALSMIDPKSYRTRGTAVLEDRAGRPLQYVNELEVVPAAFFRPPIESESSHFVLGNVFGRMTIAILEPGSWRAIGALTLAGMYDPRNSSIPHDVGNDVLNGIAWHPEACGPMRLLVTGKRWPRLHVVDLVHAPMGVEL